MQSINFEFESKRKIFHLCALVFPATYLFLPKPYMVTSLFFITLVVLLLDIFRHYDAKIKGLTSKFFINLMRDEEKNAQTGLTGASFMFSGLFLTALLFPKGLAITAWLILIISDALAALVGVKLGTKLSNGKSLEGSFAFFVSALFISIICYFAIGYNTNFFIIILSSAITTLVEFYAKQLNLNDNLIIPLSYGLTTVTLCFLFV